MVTPGYGSVSVRGKGAYLVPDRSKEPAEPTPSDLGGGVRYDITPTEMNANESPDISELRFEQHGVRKDFGYTAVGASAASEVLALGEHKFVDGGETYDRFVRVLRNADGTARLEVWDSETWTHVDDSTQTIQSTYLSMVSTQGRLCIADGTQILSWDEEPALIAQGVDYPSANSLEAVGDTVDAAITTLGAVNDSYTFHYSVSMSGTSSSDRTCTVAFLHDSDEIDTRSYNGSLTGAESWDDESATFAVKDVQNGDNLSIKLKNVDFTGSTPRSADFSPPAGVDYWIAYKLQSVESIAQKYTYNFTLTVNPCQFTGPEITADPIPSSITLSVYKDSGSGFEKIDTIIKSNSTGAPVSYEYGLDETISGMGALSRFGLKITATRANGGSIDATTVTWDEGDVAFSIHGFNEATDGDASAGVTYNTEGAPISVFDLLSADAPAASYIVAFADRLVALRGSGDPQLISASTDGDITDWVTVGYYSSSILNSPSDPLDEMMSAAEVSDGILAIFRKRSILRCTETNNPLLPMAVVGWIEGLGTESPFSVCETTDGAMFLGHDLMVYYFNGAGAPVPVGRAIQRYLIEHVTSQVARVDSAYDSVFMEYYLKLPNGRTWIFDLAYFLQTQEKRWRYRNTGIGRIATIGTKVS